VPTYSEITSSKGKGKAKAEDEDEEELRITKNHPEDEDNLLPTAHSDVDQDDFEDIVDRFESSYNFRFEEPYVVCHSQDNMDMLTCIQRCRRYQSLSS